MNSLHVKNRTNAKSRIPVPVAALKPSNSNNKERNKHEKISGSDLQKPVSFLHKKTTKQSDTKSNKNSNKFISKKTAVQPKSSLQSSRTNLKHNVHKKENFVRKNSSEKTSTKSDTSEKETKAKCPEKALVKSKTVLKCDNVEERLPVSQRSIFDQKKEVKFLTPRHINGKEGLSPNKAPFSAQKDIKFEANEFYRKMILSNRELSPSIMPRMPSLRLSNLQAQRPSCYTKMEISADPYKDALKAIENLRLSAKRNGKAPVKENKLPVSPFKDRPSFYTPYTNPKDEVMNSLRQLKLRRMQKNSPKSTKKVTFNLNVQECSPVRTEQITITDNSNQTSECRLSHITENSKENNPLSPATERTKLLSEEEKHISSPESKTLGNCDTPEKTEAVVPSKCVPKGSPASTKNIIATPGTTFADSAQPSVAKHETPENVATPSRTTVTLPHLKQKDAESRDAVSARIFTPKPLSFFAKSSMTDSCSPEFLAEGKSSMLAKYAPICTPLVLKSIAKTMCSPEAKHLSPVRLKLDFADVEKKTPRNENFRRKAVFSLENIETLQKKLDELADQECLLLLLNENTSVVCGRYLTNPVAQILNDGDDMHFIPV